MPNYDYKCKKCGHIFTEFHKVDDRKKPEKKPCPGCKAKKTIEQQIGLPGIADPVRIGARKNSKGWEDVLTKIKKAHPHNTIEKTRGL